RFLPDALEELLIVSVILAGFYYERGGRFVPDHGHDVSLEDEYPHRQLLVREPYLHAIIPVEAVYHITVPALQYEPDRCALFHAPLMVSAEKPDHALLLQGVAQHEDLVLLPLPQILEYAIECRVHPLEGFVDHRLLLLPRHLPAQLYLGYYLPLQPGLLLLDLPPLLVDESDYVPGV